MKPRPALLFATTNPGKLRELRALAEGVEVLSPDEVPGLPTVEESEPTLAGNAARKALAWARASGRVTLADDSGLFVDALDGRPGVRSARYAAGHDAARVSRLLEEMRDVPDARRTAAFRCVLCLASPGGRSVTEEGELRGSVTREPRGTGGFGYDPVLLVPELGRTLAELSLEEKGRLSHRARAFARMLPWLSAYRRGDWP
ncbi:MAG TPA: RdgB/HAM1 family non-canonical purine NTP pyrophosphatase [Myxococcaceae bacterium]|nr:RdgB/HAM1 family non-canonical purine NTP pyrophosphatase [Myxococcaceae bacterium]